MTPITMEASMDSDIQTCVTSHDRNEGYAGRIEVATGPTGRRRWPEHGKAATVLETFRDDVSVVDLARRVLCGTHERPIRGNLVAACHQR
jgi:hypothetical protein